MVLTWWRGGPHGAREGCASEVVIGVDGNESGQISK